MTAPIIRSLALAALASIASIPAHAQGTRRSGPAYNDELLEITDARITQTLKGLAAEQAEVKRVDAATAAAKQQTEADEREYQAKTKEFERQMALFRPKADAYTKCMQEASMASSAVMQDPDVANVNQKMASMSEADQEQLQKRMEALQQRMQAAQARGDQVAMRALADTAMRAMQQSTGVSVAEMQRAGQKSSQAAMAGPQKCGPAPQEPAEPRRVERESVDGTRTITLAGMKASGLGARQYALLRERLAAYAYLGDKAGTTMWAFSPAELAALKPRMADIKRYEQHMSSISVSAWSMGEEQ
jgi:predicted secreted protein